MWLGLIPSSFGEPNLLCDAAPVQPPLLPSERGGLGQRHIVLHVLVTAPYARLVFVQAIRAEVKDAARFKKIIVIRSPRCSIVSFHGHVAHVRGQHMQFSQQVWYY